MDLRWRSRQPLSDTLAMNTNMDNMEDIVVLEWKFFPPDYFEEPIHIKRDDYVRRKKSQPLTRDKGTVIGKRAVTVHTQGGFSA